MNWAYPEGVLSSAWEPRTSTINFCELDYYITPYIAEFINTISNLLFLYLAGHGLWHSSTGDTVVLWSYGLLGLVGLGSTMFHGSLKFPAQMVDEMAMVYAVATVTYAVFAIDLKKQWLPWFAGLLISAVAALTVVHPNQSDSTLHRFIFTTMVFGTATRCIMLVRRVGDVRMKSEMKQIAKIGSITYLSGTTAWIIDELRCDDLRMLRDITGMPFGFILELHGWWHILTAFGVYCYLVFVEYLRHALLSERSTARSRLVWKMNIIPHLEIVDDGKQL
ncbi:alkaline phytoceramidase [Wilcoxina mikolae CBS 423.85]|nr:alkaline phytoceramidase [Wilcoxina mikolae CBS 423.85]